MPRYDYKCRECNRSFEAIHSIHADPLDVCRLCGGGPVGRLISPPMVNTIKSGSPTGAKYEKMGHKEIVQKEWEPLAAMEAQEGMREKMQIMYSGALD